MSRLIPLEGSLGKGKNTSFRVATRAYHIMHRNKDSRQYPIIINNFNRLEWLRAQIDWLHACGLHNIHIIDNKSTYSPLLDFYKKVKATVYMLDRNVGHEALWRTHIHQRLGTYYHVYTDPDVLPHQDTPADFMAYFKSLLDKYPGIQKVGFGLATDDLPLHFTKRLDVIRWEKQFYLDPVEENVFRSRIDTTFALYRPGAAFQCWDATLRTGVPYTLKHMPWYEDPANLSAESAYYAEASSAVSSWYKHVSGENPQYNS